MRMYLQIYIEINEKADKTSNIDLMHREYYMAVRRHKVYLRVEVQSSESYI